MGDLDSDVLRYVKKCATSTRTIDLTAMATGKYSLLTANGTLSKVPVRVLIDSGATLNYASTSLVQRHIALSQQVSNGPKYRVRHADGTRTVASRHLYNVKLTL